MVYFFYVIYYTLVDFFVEIRCNKTMIYFIYGKDEEIRVLLFILFYLYFMWKIPDYIKKYACYSFKRYNPLAILDSIKINL